MTSDTVVPALVAGLLVMAGPSGLLAQEAKAGDPDAADVPAACRAPVHEPPFRGAETAVATLLTDSVGSRRAAAARALGHLLAGPESGDDGSTRPGLSGMDTTGRASGSKYEAAARKDPIRALVIGLYDPSPDVRLAAICSLGRAGDARALKHLARRQRDADENLARAARWAATRIVDRR